MKVIKCIEFCSIEQSAVAAVAVVAAAVAVVAEAALQTLILILLDWHDKFSTQKTTDQVFWEFHWRSDHEMMLCCSPLYFVQIKLCQLLVSCYWVTRQHR